MDEDKDDDEAAAAAAAAVGGRIPGRMVNNGWSEVTGPIALGWDTLGRGAPAFALFSAPVCLLPVLGRLVVPMG